MKLYVFDDGRADAWEPFALSRPVSELRFGSLLLRERLERLIGAPASALVVTRQWLADFQEPGAPGVMDPAELPESEDRLILCSRFVPDDRELELPDGRTVLRSGGQVVGCRLAAGTPNPRREWFSRPGELPSDGDLELAGRVLEEVWELVSGLPHRLLRDLEEAASRSAPARTLPRGVERVGDGPVHMGRDVRMEPGSVIDTREGPVRLGDGVEVLTGCRLEGPLHVGAGSRLLGGPLSCVAAGPFSYLRGEVEESVVVGHTNKAHAGFLGHSVAGRWVNLGALTTNSDLKNNYHPVRIGGPDGDRDTGVLKLGCFLGDHVKTAIGTLLNSGTVVGTGANVLGRQMPPKWVPPFSWGGRPGAPRYRREDFLDTALRVMERRDVEPGGAVRRWLSAVWDESARRAEDSTANDEAPAAGAP